MKIRLGLGLGLGLLACGCGDNRVAPDAVARCAATFAGNFAETDASPAACPTLDPASGSSDRLLDFTIDSPGLDAKMIVSIDLGPTPTVGERSSETLASWHAVGAKSIGDGACVYSAGDQVTPHGSFTLTLTAVDAAALHGTLDIVTYLHAVDATSCGASDTETLDLAF